VGIAFAQCVHASGESSDGNLSPGTYAVALGVETEGELCELADELEERGVPVHRVVESAGRYAGQVMALGVKPGPKSIRGKYLSTLSLLRMVDFVEHHDYMQEEWAKRRTQEREISKLKEKIQDLESSWWQRFKARWWSPGRNQTQGVGS